jgi:hypothetical protein
LPSHKHLELRRCPADAVIVGRSAAAERVKVVEVAVRAAQKKPPRKLGELVKADAFDCKGSDYEERAQVASETFPQIGPYCIVGCAAMIIEDLLAIGARLGGCNFPIEEIEALRRRDASFQDMCEKLTTLDCALSTRASAAFILRSEFGIGGGYLCWFKSAWQQASLR